MEFDNSVDDKKWCAFKIDDIFDVSRPVARVKTKYHDGNIPFVASGNFNNGVERYVKPLINDVLDEGNSITISPLTGTAYYQEKPFLGRGGAGSSIIVLKNKKLNKQNGLFICSVISKVCEKYSYKDMGNQKRVRSEVLYLPCLNDEPDWEYMEKYIKAILIDTRNRIDSLKRLI